MNGVTYARTQLEGAFSLLNMCADGMDDTQYNFSPGGTCNPPAKSHVHSLTAVDFFVLATAKGDQMLWTSVAKANGLPENSLQIWGHEGTIPVAPVKEYGQQVQKAALDYVATLKDDDLDRVIETQYFGKQTVTFLLQLAGNHAVGHGGDIAAVKGMQGLKGLPF